MDHNSVSQENTSPKRPPKPSNKRMIWAVLAGIAIFTAVILRIIFLQNDGAIPDTNGPDVYDLNTIIAEEIEGRLCDYSSVLVSSSRDGKQSGIDDGRIKNFDYDSFSFNAGRLDGIKVVHATKIEGDTLRLEITSNVTEGNLAIVVLVENKIERYVDINSTQTVILEDISGKAVLVKVAGESAKFNIDITRQYE